MKQKIRAKRKTASPEHRALEAEYEIASVRPRELYQLAFDRTELVHLRDLFSVLLPPAADKSISHVLATTAGRPFTEAKLWKKIQTACVEASVPVGDAAPDFIVTISAAPELTVFQIEQEVSTPSNDSASIMAVLTASEEDDEPEQPAKKKRSRRQNKEEA